MGGTEVGDELATIKAFLKWREAAGFQSQQNAC
jgi:hypothetical protein